MSKTLPLSRTYRWAKPRNTADGHSPLEVAIRLNFAHSFAFILNDLQIEAIDLYHAFKSL
jgi:hypothetical protein